MKLKSTFRFQQLQLQCTGALKHRLEESQEFPDVQREEIAAQSLMNLAHAPEEDIQSNLELSAFQDAPGSPPPAFDSVPSGSLFPSASDDGNHHGQPPGSLSADRPSKVSRRSSSHSYAMQPVLAPIMQEGFIIQYAPKFQASSQELGLAPGGISWLEFYKINQLDQLSYAQKKSVSPESRCSSSCYACQSFTRPGRPTRQAGCT
jgi:hypothetical protein